MAAARGGTPAPVALDSSLLRSGRTGRSRSRNRSCSRTCSWQRRSRSSPPTCSPFASEASRSPPGRSPCGSPAPGSWSRSRYGTTTRRRGTRVLPLLVGLTADPELASRRGGARGRRAPHLPAVGGCGRRRRCVRRRRPRRSQRRSPFRSRRSWPLSSSGAPRRAAALAAAVAPFAVVAALRSGFGVEERSLRRPRRSPGRVPRVLLEQAPPRVAAVCRRVRSRAPLAHLRV